MLPDILTSGQCFTPKCNNKNNNRNNNNKITKKNSITIYLKTFL